MEKDVYVLITWPDSQDLMDEDWFRDEAVLHNDTDKESYNSSSYFIPIERYREYYNSIDDPEVIK